MMMSTPSDNTTGSTPPAPVEPKPSTTIKAEPSTSPDPIVTPAIESISPDQSERKQEPSPALIKAPTSEEPTPIVTPTPVTLSTAPLPSLLSNGSNTPKVAPDAALSKNILSREPSSTPVSDTSNSTTNSRINKNDALNYLDQVKTQFQGQPEVYNKFLEIMKEFKAHLIDTNAVIERVSSLFAGHPNLIEGFNTFLPQEHRIKLHKNIAPSPGVERATPESHGTYLPPGFRPPSDYYMPSLPGVPQLRANNYYTPNNPSQTPSSSSNRLMNVASKYGTNWPTDAWSGPAPHPSQPGMAYSHPPTGSYQTPGTLMPSSAANVASVAAKPPSGYGAVQLPQPPPPPGSGGNASATAPPDASATARKPSMGMIQAVSYLRKIQERFYKQPEIYQSFVEILRSYQKEQKPIRDVYLQVSNLFGNHLDLLEEFTQFIPDAQGLFQGRPGSSTVVESQSRQGQAAYTGRISATSGSFESAPPYASANANARRGRGGASVRGAGAPKRPVSPNMDGHQKRSKFGEGGRERPMGELEFFDRVKRHLNHNDQLYSEFLKCLNWYTQDILKKSELVKVAHSFIGRSEELFSWFKNFIGYTEGDADIVQPNGEAEITTDAYLLDLTACKRVGSYRIFPKNYQQPICSGRTPLCIETCNDQLVSCPTFNSEDSTFVSSRKNIYEEALFRCEDDRYELDRLIDANQATIANFEPILKKIQTMSQKEAEKFTLTDALGGSSEVIYRNAIQKVYGPRADEILASLKKNPAVSIPIVLKRLKQKDEEWRSAQRDWNKIWRDVHFKNYYKALDNQGVNFKTSDRKILSTKSLVNEIQTIYFEQLKGNLASTIHLLPSSQGLVCLEKSPTLPPANFVSSLSSGNQGLPYQLDFKVADVSIYEDLLKLILYLAAKSSAFSNSERKSLEKFIINFLPDFFSLKAKVEHGSPLSDREDSGMDDSSNERPDSFGYYSSVTLEPLNEKKANLNQAEGTGASLIFANENIYTLFRLFQISYHRLEQMKTLSSSFQDNPVYQHKKNYIASFLDIQKKASGGMHISSDYYSVLLEMIKQLMEGSLESSNFEEKIRLMFGAHAFLMFTFDRVIYTLLKQVLAILGDATSEHVIALYDSFKRPKKGSIFSEYSYKVAARSLVGHENGANLFRIESQRGGSGSGGEAKSNLVWWLKFRYLPSQSISASEGLPLSAHEKWSLYVDQFVDVHYDPSLLSRKPPLLLVKQLKRSSSDRLKNMTIQYNLECKICVNTFKMFFVDDSEDFIYKPTTQGAGTKEIDREKKLENGQPLADTSVDKYPTKCVERFEKWLQQRYAEMNADGMEDDTTAAAEAEATTTASAAMITDAAVEVKMEVD